MHKARMLAVVTLVMASMALQVPVTAMAAPSITAIESSDAGQNDVTVYFDTLVGKVPTITTSSSLAGTVYLNDVDVFDSANKPHTIPHATSVWVKTPDSSGVTYESPYSVRVDNAGHTLDRRAVDLVIDCDEVYVDKPLGKDTNVFIFRDLAITDPSYALEMCSRTTLDVNKDHSGVRAKFSMHVYYHDTGEEIEDARMYITFSDLDIAGYPLVKETDVYGSYDSPYCESVAWDGGYEDAFRVGSHNVLKTDLSAASPRFSATEPTSGTDEWQKAGVGAYVTSGVTWTWWGQNCGTMIGFHAYGAYGLASLEKDVIAPWMPVHPMPGWDWTVAYDANGGTGEVEAASGRATGEGIDVAASDGSGLRREGYSFVGWNTAADGSGTAVEAGGTVHVAAGSPSVTLHAQWEELKSGWVEEGGTRHYYDPTTHELARGHVYIDGRFWWLDEQTGDPVTGWHHVDSTGADEYYDQGLMALGWHKTSGRWSGWQYFAKTGKVGERCPLRYSDGSQDMNYVHEVRWKSLPTWSETNYLIVIDTDNYNTVCFQRDGDDWRPIYSWHSVGGDVNRGHTAQGTLWVNGRQADAPGAEWTDRWWVNFNKWTSVSGPEGQAFHYWRYEGRTMNGSGSDGCDMVNWGAAEWIWRNVPDGTGVYSIPGWNTHDYSGVGGQDKYGHTYYHVWSDAERDAAARLYPGEF